MDCSINYWLNGYPKYFGIYCWWLLRSNLLRTSVARSNARNSPLEGFGLGTWTGAYFGTVDWFKLDWMASLGFFSTEGTRNDSSPVPHLEKAGKCTTYYVHARMYISLSEASGLNRFLGSPVAPVGDGARFEKPVIVQGTSSRTWTLPCQSA